MYRPALAIVVSLLAAGCAKDTAENKATFGGGTTTAGAGSACTELHTPQYAVAGKTNLDQAWINRTTEGLVTGCNQPRPLPRPASMDAPPPKAAIAATTAEPTPEKQAAKRKRWFGF